MDKNEELYVKSVILRQLIQNQERLLKMNLQEYQKAALSTNKYTEAAQKYMSAKNNEFGIGEIENDIDILMCALGLAGEAGETVDKLKKIYRDKQGNFNNEDVLAIVKELGDVLWYVAVLGKKLGWDLEDIAKLNIDKLAVRERNKTIHGSGDNR